MLDTEIVGVVREVRPNLHADRNPMVYFPTRQPPNFTASPHGIAVRVTERRNPLSPPCVPRFSEASRDCSLTALPRCRPPLIATSRANG
jgi:hypothetical protein